MAAAEFYGSSNDTNINFITYSPTNNFSVTGQNDTYSHKWSFEFSVVLACILSVSSFCTVVGNIMVLMVIIRHKGMRTRTNLFLLNLAIADLFVGLFLEPFSITTLIQNDWVFGPDLCLLNGWMNSFCLVTSFHTLMYISIHKYFSIVRPLSNPLKLSYIIAMMMSAWLWAGICSTLNMTVLVVEYKPGTSQCGPRYPERDSALFVHAVLQVTVMYLPASILVFCYFRIFRAIKKLSERLRRHSTVEEEFILSQQKKVTKTLFIVLATFVMMALPYHVYAMYAAIKVDKGHFPSFINPLAYMFLYLNSVCNPIIYAFRSPAFREGYKEILCQTPNYVISDECDQVSRTMRLSSLICSLRRISSLRTNSRTVVSNADNTDLTSKSTETGEKRMKPKFYRQKSLLELLRSTRQSETQSVVHRNGDVIIMKGGKIVSVRSGGKGNPFMDRLKTFNEANQKSKGLTAGLAGTGQVILGLVCEGVADKKNEPDEHEAMLECTSNSQNITEFLELQECEEVSNKNCDLSCHVHNKNKCIEEQGLKYKRINKDNLKCSREMKTGNYKASEQSENPHLKIKYSSLQAKKSTFFKPVIKKLSDSNAAYGPVNNSLLSVNCFHKQSRTCVDEPSAADTVSPLHSEGVVIHVGDDDDILSLMPLTPHTKEYLAKSEVHISNNDPGNEQASGDAFVFKTMTVSHSSDHVLKKPPVIQRLPSLEFLDPPVHLFRSHSNISLHSSIEKLRRISRSNRKRERSQSPDVGSSSKSYLRSTFSSKHKVTHI